MGGNAGCSVILEQNRLRVSGALRGQPVSLRVSTRHPRSFVSGVAMSGQHHPVIDGMKVCCGCGENKPLSDYYKSPNGRDGVRSRCIKCHSVEQQVRYAANPTKYALSVAESRERHQEAYRERVRGYYRRDIEYSHQRIKRYAQSHPERNSAHCKVRDALKSGLIIKPKSCSKCNKIGEVEGHHEDYARPLEVKWLCSVCHSDLHWARRNYSTGSEIPKRRTKPI